MLHRVWLDATRLQSGLTDFAGQVVAESRKQRCPRSSEAACNGGVGDDTADVLDQCRRVHLLVGFGHVVDDNGGVEADVT
ncbi:MAG TPA: hypothetical protein VGH69_09655, partial [Mycobacterium sp.]